VATEAEGLDPNFQFTELEQAFGSGQNVIWFENSAPWPKGKYRVDLALNGQLAQSLDVEVVSTNTSGAVITEAHSTLDEAGQQASSTFPQDGTVYIQFTLDSAPADTAVRGVMVATDAEGLDPYTYVTEAGSNLGSGSYWFTFTNSNPWPVGSYVVYIYLNGELAGRVELQVQ
jgi:outer membrane usher protein FimD/PapC